MKTKLKMIVLLIIMAQVTISGKLIAAPIFGLPGQGTPRYNPMDGSMGCDPGSHWCKFEMAPEKNHSINVAAFEMTEEGEVTVTCPIDYLELKFEKMFVGNKLIISYPVPLDTKISTALATQMNKKNKALLFLKTGSYPYEVIGKQIRIAHVKVGDMKDIGAAFKALIPPFVVYNIEILCCGNRTSQKKIHVISNALTGSGTKLQIKNASGTIIATYPNLVADFTTPCLTLTGGQYYSIGFIDLNGDEFSGFTQSKLAPLCPLERKYGPAKKLDAIANTDPFDPTDQSSTTGDHVDHYKTNYIGHVTLLRYTELYLGYELMHASCSNEQTTSIIDKSASMSAHLYVPIIRSKKGWDGTVKGRVSIGLNAGIIATRLNGNYDLTTHTAYNISGMTNTVISARGSGSPKAAAFKYEAGPQMNITRGSLTLSPILNLGYESFTQKSYSIEQSGIINGINQTLKIYESAQLKTTRFIVSPKLRLAYNPGRIGIWIEGQYAKGPDIKTTGTMLKPSSNPDKTGAYTYAQFVEGSSVPTEQKLSLPCVGVSAGLVLSLKRKHDYVGHVTLLK